MDGGGFYNKRQRNVEMHFLPNSISQDKEDKI